MTTLKTDPNLDAPDDFYELLVSAHRGLDDAQSAMLNAKLVLLLANHVGERSLLEQAIAAARDDAAIA